MDSQDTKSITVIIGGRPYPLKINVDDEAAIRRIVKEVNEKINSFQMTYTNKDKQDCLAMAVLTYAVDLHKKEETSQPDKEISAKLTQLDELLDSLVT